MEFGQRIGTEATDELIIDNLIKKHIIKITCKVFNYNLCPHKPLQVWGRLIICQKVFIKELLE